MARLILVTAEAKSTVELSAFNSLGRHPNNTIQVLDKVVSKEHCVIELRGGAFVLRDLGSLNGTYVNGERIVGERVLVHGDEIAIGSSRARFLLDDEIPLRPSHAPTSGHPPVAPPSHIAHAAPAPQQPMPTSLSGRVDVEEKAQAIGAQINAEAKGFLPYEAIAHNPVHLRADYERLRLSHELSRELALERDMDRLLEKILVSVFKFTRADRGVIFLKDETGQLVPLASHRRDGKDAPIQVSRTILAHVVKERAAVLTHDAALDFSSQGKSMILNRISSAIVVPLLHEQEVLGVLWLDSETLAQFQTKDLELVAAIANQAAMFIEINILGKKIEQEVVNRERFSRLLSPNVAERVLSGQLEVKPGGERVPSCTVLNSDIRGFTRMSENTDPELIVEMLNEYFEEMVECLFEYEGTLDKFMGDGIMALFGAPVSQPDDAVRAVDCALAKMVRLEKLNQRRIGRGQLPLAVGIGIHTGPVVAGYIGSSKALSYTVIGDTANTSARLCGVAESGQILISETTRAHLGGRFELRELPPAHVKGKEQPLRVFDVVGKSPQVQVP